MGRVCIHAEIQPRPCPGTVFSREITCKAGLPNTCLRNCNEKCPAYKVAEPPRPSMFIREQIAPQQYGVRATSQHAVFQPTVPRAPASPNQRGPCGTCGATKGS